MTVNTYIFSLGNIIAGAILLIELLLLSRWHKLPGFTLFFVCMCFVCCLVELVIILQLIFGAAEYPRH
jgi:hypothetical protein